MKERGRHQVRAAQDCVRNTRVILGMLKDVVTGTVELAERDVVTVAFSSFRVSEEGDLDKVLYLLLLAGLEKGREDVSPPLHVRECAEDRFDPRDGCLETSLVGPVKVNNFSTLLFENIRNVIGECFLSRSRHTGSDLQTKEIQLLTSL